MQDITSLRGTSTLSNKIPLNYKGNRIDSELKVINHESIPSLLNFFKKNHDMEIPDYILWNMSDSLADRSFKIQLPFIRIINQYDKLMIEMLVNQSDLTDDPWERLEYTLNNDYYVTICDKFNNIDSKLKVIGKAIN